MGMPGNFRSNGADKANMHRLIALILLSVALVAALNAMTRPTAQTQLARELPGNADEVDT
jgi:hypothetical protein